LRGRFSQSEEISLEAGTALDRNQCGFLPVLAKWSRIMLEPINHTPTQPKSTIEINLNRLPQLFNSLDPSPFHERDLDQDAEEYIIGSAEEISHHRPSALVIHLPADQVPEPDALNLADAIHNFFAYRETHERRRLRLLFHDGRVALAIGLGFLFCCVLLRELIYSFEHSAASDIFGEGMLIIGWVAMWRPLEIFLYEWVPIRRRCQILRTLSRIPVTVRPK
jgi:hypothetical protein